MICGRGLTGTAAAEIFDFQLDESLKRMKVDYVDIFYHHRMDPETPLEETMMALDQIVKSGKALYAGISNYSREYTEKAMKILSRP